MTDWLCLGLLALAALVVLAYLLDARREAALGHCPRGSHQWAVRRVTTAMRDTSRGELWRCSRCPKVVCK